MYTRTTACRGASGPAWLRLPDEEMTLPACLGQTGINSRALDNPARYLSVTPTIAYLTIYIWRSATDAVTGIFVTWTEWLT